MVLTLVWNIDTLCHFTAQKETKKILNNTGYCTKPRTDGFMEAGASVMSTAVEVSNWEGYMYLERS